MADDQKPFSRLSPQVERTSLPFYYVGSDIPHVLARVRMMRLYLEALDDRKDLPDEAQVELYKLFTHTMNDSLAPYALDLARSLIVLEDSIGAAGGPTVKTRRK